VEEDLDRWRPVRPLGAGAFGQVHLAWDTVEQRYVALKRFTGQDELGLLRFVIESRIRVAHPHLVRTLAFRLVDDRAVLVTELARGGSVRQLMDRSGPLPLGWVVEAVDHVLDALVALHATGVVHRDLKPANLLLRDGGAAPPHLLVGDFGIATWRTVSMTGIGAAIGTPGYLAPEYLDGTAPSPTTDLFAVGVLAAELLAGRRLVHYSNSSPDIPADWTTQLPLPDDVPPGTAAVLRRMADPDVQRRYTDCAQARDALLAAAAPPGRRGDLTAVPLPDLLAGLPPGWTLAGPAEPEPATTTLDRTPPSAPANAPEPDRPETDDPVATSVAPDRAVADRPEADHPVVTESVADPAQLAHRDSSVAYETEAEHPGPDRPATDDPAGTGVTPDRTSADRPETDDPVATNTAPDETGPDRPEADHPVVTESVADPGPHAYCDSAAPHGPEADHPGPDHPATDDPVATRAAPDRTSADRPEADHLVGIDGAAPDHDAAATRAVLSDGAGRADDTVAVFPDPVTVTPPPLGPSAPHRPATVPWHTTETSTSDRKPRRRRKRRRVVAVLVLVLLLGGGGAVWWAATHQTITGTPIAGNDSGTVDDDGDPDTPPVEWRPVQVERCAKVDLGQERVQDGERQRCQRTQSQDAPQHWVREPPGGFPKSDPAGPFPGEDCARDSDTAFSPVGAQLLCRGDTWQPRT
jgi:serine/threonine protein kinase